MNCPNCGHPEPDGSAECSGCGVIFAKWKARRERAQAAMPEAPDGAALLDSAPASELLKYKKIAFGVAAAFSIIASLVISRVMHRAGGKALQVLATQQPALKSLIGRPGGADPIDPNALLRRLSQSQQGQGQTPQIQRLLNQLQQAPDRNPQAPQPPAQPLRRLDDSSPSQEPQEAAPGRSGPPGPDGGAHGQGSDAP